VAACPIDPIDRPALERMLRHGLLCKENERLRATDAGRQRLTGLLARLLR
jgi:hypothetical protein